MTKPVRIGVIGCGAIATAVHIRVLRGLPGVRVTALADPEPQARARAGRLVPRAVLLASPEELLAREDVDAVVVASPTALHAPMALAVFAAGRHLYLEKPIATTVDDGRQVAAAASATHVVSMAGFNWRFQPLIARAKVLLSEGVLGEVRAATTAFCEAASVPGWKARRHDGGGVLLDLGSHHFDLMRWLLGAEMSSVHASVESRRTEHDVAAITLMMDSGATVASVFSLGVEQAHWIELVGERGTMRIDRQARTLTVSGVRARTLTPALLAWRARSLVRPLSEPSWGYALRAFVGNINGADLEVPTMDDGVRSLEIVAAAERAAGVA